MPRIILDESCIHPAVRPLIAALHRGVLDEVQTAVTAHRVVVVGMAQNPMVTRAHKYLDAAGIAHHDLSYGGYFSEWRKRNALKMWTGWPTFPMVFVEGVLLGGANDVKKLINAGALRPL
jgi:glutaredoxin-related protein